MDQLSGDQTDTVTPVAQFRGVRPPFLQAFGKSRNLPLHRCYCRTTSNRIICSFSLKTPQRDRGGGMQNAMSADVTESVKDFPPSDDDAQFMRSS